jgi:hypothetical protein
VLRSCEKIRNHKNRWLQVVDYQSAHFAVLSVPSIFSQLLSGAGPIARRIATGALSRHPLE